MQMAGCGDRIVSDPTFHRRLRRYDEARIMLLCLIACEVIDQISVAAVDLLPIVVATSSASVKVDHQRIFFLLIVVQRSEEPIEQSLTVRVLKDLRRQNLFSLLDRAQLLRRKRKGREQYQDYDRDDFRFTCLQSSYPFYPQTTLIVYDFCVICG